MERMLFTSRRSTTAGRCAMNSGTATGSSSWGCGGLGRRAGRPACADRQAYGVLIRWARACVMHFCHGRHAAGRFMARQRVSRSANRHAYVGLPPMGAAR